MYEIVTKSIPYPSSVTRLCNKFLHRVADEDLRPTFTVPVKPSIKKLIESCWSKNPDERPTFEEIFKKLAYNSKIGEIEFFATKMKYQQIIKQMIIIWMELMSNK